MDAARAHADPPAVTVEQPYPGRSASRRHVGLAATITVLLLALAYGAFRLHAWVTFRDPPAVSEPDLLAMMTDDRIVPITLTTPEWTKFHTEVTVDRLRSDRMLWRQMHFGDWDRVPREIREEALHSMVRRYVPIFHGPGIWRRMTASDWDDVPQPIRAMAYLRMARYWAREEEVGEEFGFRPERLAQTIGAIIMTESWFEHRALNENPYGNRDLGLAQCSDHCRSVLQEMAERGDIAFQPSEEDFFNPWTATRVATVWFERELQLSGGDVDLAIRAYHRGQDAAMDEKGDAYLERVRDLRDRYVRSMTASPSWRFVVGEVSRL